MTPTIAVPLKAPPARVGGGKKPSVLEYREVHDFRLGSYLKDVPLPKVQIAKILHCTSPQLEVWIGLNRMPLVVYERLREKYPNEKFKTPKQRRVASKPFRLDPFYASALGIDPVASGLVAPAPVPTPVEPPPPPPPAPLPDSVPWAVYERTVTMFYHHHAVLIESLATANAENARQALTIQMLSNHLGTEAQLNALDREIPKMAIPTTEVDVTRDALGLLGRLKDTNGNGKVFSDLERRIAPFVKAP